MCLRRALQSVLTLVLMLGAHAEATAMRCGTELINVGDLRQEVLVKCGQPAARAGDKWIYDQGPDEFTKVVHIRDERVLSIEEGTYGTPGHDGIAQ